MSPLNVRYVKDRHGRPLLVVDGLPGGGAELYPQQVRELALALLEAADRAEPRNTHALNQSRLRSLCESAGISQEAAAQLITQQTQRPCSVRTVRAWLADPGKPSARPCPDWGVQALETRLRTLKQIS